jgi:hypothetical protein
MGEGHLPLPRARNLKIIVGFVFVVGGVLFGCSTADRHRVEPVSVSEIKIAFAKRQVAPPPGQLPKDAEYPKGADAKDHGALTNIVAGRMAALTVTWVDPEIFKSQSQVQDFLRELLCSTNENTFTWHIYSWGDGSPCVVAKVEHINGKPGKWWVWDSPALFWAYQDGNGKWWWGSWDYRTPKPKSLGAGGKL